VFKRCSPGCFPQIPADTSFHPMPDLDVKMCLDRNVELPPFFFLGPPKLFFFSVLPDSEAVLVKSRSFFSFSSQSPRAKPQTLRQYVLNVYRYCDEHPPFPSPFFPFGSSFPHVSFDRNPEGRGSVTCLPFLSRLPCACVSFEPSASPLWSLFSGSGG